MSRSLDRRAAPGLPALGVALLLSGIVGAVALQRGAPHAVAVPEVAVQQRELRFADQPDGAIAVTDARDGAPVAVLPPGTNGFARGTLRGLLRDRHREALGPEAPFRLALWPGGAFTLQDLATGRVIDLRAFGDTNRDAFARLLTSQGPAP